MEEFLIDSFGEFDILYFDDTGKVAEMIGIRNEETTKSDTLDSLGVWNSKSKEIVNIFYDSLVRVQKLNTDWREA